MKKIQLQLMLNVDLLNLSSAMKIRLFGTGENILFSTQFRWKIYFSHGISLKTRCLVDASGKLKMLK